MSTATPQDILPVEAGYAGVAIFGAFAFLSMCGLSGALWTGKSSRGRAMRTTTTILGSILPGLIYFSLACYGLLASTAVVWDGSTVTNSPWLVLSTWFCFGGVVLGIFSYIPPNYISLALLKSKNRDSSDEDDMLDLAQTKHTSWTWLAGVMAVCIWIAGACAAFQQWYPTAMQALFAIGGFFAFASMITGFVIVGALFKAASQAGKNGNKPGKRTYRGGAVVILVLFILGEILLIVGTCITPTVATEQTTWNIVPGASLLIAACGWVMLVLVGFSIWLDFVLPEANRVKGQ